MINKRGELVKILLVEEHRRTQSEIIRTGKVSAIFDISCHVIVGEDSQTEAEIYLRGYGVIIFETGGLKVSQLS
jgi:hypothetical protein